MASEVPVRITSIALFLICFSFILATPVRAGFEWLPNTQENTLTPQIKTKKLAPKPALKNTDRQMPRWGGTMSSTSSPQEPTQMKIIRGQEAPAHYNNAAPQQEWMRDTMQNTPFAAPAAMLEQTQAQPSSTLFFPDAVGFGADMPLAFALRQVVPEGYTQSFGKNVNLGARVSWNGGKPWNQVVTDMVAPLGLYLNIEGQKAFISTAPPSTQQRSLQSGAGAAPTALIQGKTNPTAPRLTEQNVQFWQGYQGQSVRDILIEWAPKANIELVWEATGHYKLASNVLINDTFNNALIKMFNNSLVNGRMPVISFAKPSMAGKTATLIVKDRNS